MSLIALPLRKGSRLCVLCAIALVSALEAAVSAFASDRVGPSVQDVVEFTRIIQPHSEDPDELQAQVSPNGRHAFIVTRKADVRTDRNRFQILLLDLRPARLAARRWNPPEVLLTVLATQDSYYADPFIQDARWVGDRTIVFRGRMKDAPFQVYRVDVSTRRLTQLTFEALSIVSFAVPADLAHVLCTVQVPNPPMEPGARSVVVANRSFWSVKFGQYDLRSQERRYQYILANAGSHKPGRKLGASFAMGSAFVPGVSLSPDGRWALLPRYEPDRQQAWSQQYPLVAELSEKVGTATSLDPQSYFSRPLAYVPRRMVAYRLSDGREQTVVDAPDDALNGPGQVRSDRLWQHGGKSVIFAGTFLPLQAAMGSGSNIIEYWPDSGRWKLVAALKGRLSSAYALPGGQDAFVAIDGELRRSFERRDDGGWRELDSTARLFGSTPHLPLLAGGWTLGINQGLNEPPDVIAKGPAGQTVKLTHLNPQYSIETWGVIRPYAWKDAKGRSWDGGLMVPSDFDPGVRHALVIQTYGFSPSRFYLDGSNLADGFTSGFAGRAFLREDMLVLALPWRASTGAPTDDRGGIEAFNDGVQAAIDSLVDAGLVDRDRVGILGWSATGERVLNLVTFSGAPIRAATLLDGDANTLFSVAVTYGASENMLVRKERINQGEPFGESLQSWVRNDPALHTDCVSAALRIESYGPWVLNNWDIYALLRRQYKPVEMIVIPEGTHALSRPSERMISLQGNVDWYRFWLKGEERHEIMVPSENAQTLGVQYERWRGMAQMKRTEDAKPRCVRQDAAR